MLVVNPKMRSLIDRLWNRLWSGGISNPLSAIEQITYLLFMKHLDAPSNVSSHEHIIKDRSRSMFAGSYKIPGTDELVAKETLAWSNFKSMQPEELIEHVKNKVFPYIKEIDGDDSGFAKQMSNAVFIIPNGDLLKAAMKDIDEIYDEILKESAAGGHRFQDIQGDIYEMLLDEISSSGKNGQFRTPRHIIKFIVDIVGPEANKSICDPSCGTGGFLLDAAQFIATQLAKKKKPRKLLLPDEDGFTRIGLGSALVTEKEKSSITKNIVGYDFDGTMVRLAYMNLFMHGVHHPRIEHQDSLSRGFKESSAYDIILANPPFTGSINKEQISDLLTIQSTRTEVLFVERIMTLLVDRGFAAVIVPQGVLYNSNSSFVSLRQKLIQETQLDAVISLPSGVFRPYAGVATAILFFKKGLSTRRTWMCNVTNDGFTLDDRRRKIAGSELPSVVELFRNRERNHHPSREGSCFFVDAHEIESKQFDLSFPAYRAIVPSSAQYRDPNEILSEIAANEEEISKSISNLRNVLQ